MAFGQVEALPVDGRRRFDETKTLAKGRLCVSEGAAVVKLPEREDVPGFSAAIAFQESAAVVLVDSGAGVCVAVRVCALIRASDVLAR